MNIGPYTFEEFKQKAADFHGYPAPGLLLGGYMVEKARRELPEGTLFEALVESRKCLPDAVQLLTLCSVGNNWMKVLNLGRYALSLYDKYTGQGVRVFVDIGEMRAWPELTAWFMKLKPKREQDSGLLFRELEAAGETVCSIMPVRINARFLGHAHSSGIGVCPCCGEPFPSVDGGICRGCQGEAPYAVLAPGAAGSAVSGCSPSCTPAPVRVVPVEEAVGKKALHDMTEIIPGRSKGAAFRAGQTIGSGDVCRLQQMGRSSVAVEDESAPAGFAHENAGAGAFAGRMAGENIEYALPPKEGKITFRAVVSGLFTVDRQRLLAFNMVPDVMCATRQDGLEVDAGSEVAGARVIPLYISGEHLAEALSVLDGPLFFVAPMRRARVGVLVTGSEVFQGLIEDKFIPVVSAKVKQRGCTVVKTVIAPDDTAAIREGIEAIRAAGADLLVTTGGMSVDPGDVTRAALMEAGVRDVLYGAPVLPGTMTLTGFIPAPETEEFPPESGFSSLPPGAMQVMGVPACALYHKVTLFDALLPRMLAGRRITRAELAYLGEGGFCMNCKACTWPKCFFIK